MNCLYCNSETKAGNKYCDKNCMYKYHTKRRGVDYPISHCKACNAEFKPKTKFNRFCSFACLRKSEKKPKVECACTVCGKLYLRSGASSKYCSDSCRRSARKVQERKPLPNKECSYCGVSYKPYRNSDKFCSTECRVNNMKSTRKFNWTKEGIEKRKGVLNPAYKHGLACRGVKKSAIGLRTFQKNRNEMKSQMKDEFGYLFCEYCGHTTNRIEAHHIIFRSEKPNHANLHDKPNILLVCVPCHNKFHNYKSLRDSIVISRGLNVIFGDDVIKNK